MSYQLTYKHPLFGLVTFETNSLAPKSPITHFTSGFDSADVTDVVVPQLIGAVGVPASGKIRFHKRGQAQLLEAFAEIERQGLKKNLKKFSGSYNARLINPQRTPPPKTVRTPSNHSFGTAIDLNAFANELTLNTPMAPIFEAFGFLWGKSFNDPMHFEVKTFVDNPQPVTHEAQLVFQGNLLAIPLKVISGRTMVAIRLFVTRFGGGLEVNGSKVQLTNASGAKMTLDLVIIAGVGFCNAPMAAAHFGMTFAWDNAAKVGTLA